MSDIPGDASAARAADSAAGQGWIARFVRNRVAGNVLMVLLIVGGLLAVARLDVLYLPEIDWKQIHVTVPYPGASPAEVEERITKRLEQGLRGVEDVDWIASRATANFGEVTLHVAPGGSSDRVLEDVRAAVSQIEAFPPRNAERPEFVMRTADTSTKMILAVSSSSASPLYLRRAADDLREHLLALPHVSDVELRFAPDREVRVEVDEEALDEYGLTVSEIGRKLNATSLDRTAGELSTDVGGVVPRVRERRRTGAELEDVVLLARPGGATVRLGDVATVRDELQDTGVVTEVDGIPTVLVALEHHSGAATDIEVVESVLAMLDSYEPPAGVQVSVWRNILINTLDGVNSVLYAGIIATALVAVALALVLDLRLAMWVALGVPTSFLGALLLFPAFDLVISAATLFGLVIVVGIVVDDAVVVGESIARQRELGLVGADAAVSGARRVFRPVALGIATTMIATVPAFFTEGGIGQVLNVLPIVVILTLAMSMAEAFLILPTHLAHGGEWSRWPLSAVQARFRRALDRLRDERTLPAIDLAVRKPGWTVLVGAGIAVAALALVAAGVVEIGYQPNRASDRVLARLTYPAGTPLEVTEAGARKLVATAERLNDAVEERPIAQTGMVVGHYFSRPSRTSLLGGQFDTNTAGITLRLTPDAERSMTPEQVARRWRDSVGTLAHGGSLIISSSPASESYDLTLALLHSDEAVLAQAVAELAATLDRIPGVFQVDHTQGRGKRHYELKLTAAGEAAGLDARSLGGQLRARFFGAEVQRNQRGRDEVKVTVGYPGARRGSVADLLDERLDVPAGGQIPLSEAVEIVEVQQPEMLMRVDGLRAAEVRARVDSTVITPTAVTRQLSTGALPELAARHPGLAHRFTGDTGAFIQGLATLTYTAPLALLVMYILIAWQFKSFGRPLVILATVPMAFAGAVFLHLILGYHIYFAALVGVVAATGVAVNDTLLLMDRYYTIRAHSEQSAAQAVRAAVRERFRPIVLTTVTTFIGLLPILYIPSEATSRILLPTVISLIGGLVAASIAILFLVPAILTMAEGSSRRVPDRLATTDALA